MVVQADDLLGLSTIVICPTSQSAPPASFHPEIEIGSQTTRVLCEMVSAVDARVLGEQIGHLTANELRDVEEGLASVLDLA